MPLLLFVLVLMRGSVNIVFVRISPDSTENSDSEWLRYNNMRSVNVFCLLTHHRQTTVWPYLWYIYVTWRYHSSYIHLEYWFRFLYSHPTTSNAVALHCYFYSFIQLFDFAVLLPFLSHSFRSLFFTGSSVSYCATYRERLKIVSPNWMEKRRRIIKNRFPQNQQNVLRTTLNRNFLWILFTFTIAINLIADNGKYSYINC